MRTRVGASMLSLVLAVGFLVAIPAGPAGASTAVLDPVDRGWWTHEGIHFADNPVYFVGDNGTVGGNLGAARNYFAFSLATVPATGGMITGATLSAINPNSGPGTVRPYVLWDVTTSQASLHAGDTGSAAGIAIYGDLGSGTTFGSVLPASLSTSPIVVPFNAAGIAALNAARGGPMSIGGDLQGAVGPDDYMFTDTEFATSVSLTLTIAGPAHQPDALIRGGLASAYLGDDIYNQTGARQTFVRQVRPGFGDQFNMRIENDGSLEDSFSVHGAGSSMKFKVSYWYGATDVTSEVVAGTFRTPNLKPGASVHLMAFIYARRGTRSGASMTDLIAVTSVGPTEERTNGIVHAMDVVGARLVVNKKAGDLNSQLPIP